MAGAYQAHTDIGYNNITYNRSRIDPHRHYEWFGESSIYILFMSGRGPEFNPLFFTSQLNALSAGLFFG